MRRKQTPFMYKARSKYVRTNRDNFNLNEHSLRGRLLSHTRVVTLGACMHNCIVGLDVQILLLLVLMLY